MFQEEKQRTFKTLYRARQKSAVTLNIPKQPTEEKVQNKEIDPNSKYQNKGNGNININGNNKSQNYPDIRPKVRSMTPLARSLKSKSPIKDVQQINISVNNNKPNNANEEGVCTNCVNNLLANQLYQLSHTKDKPALNNFFDLQDKQNGIQKERIHTSINQRMNLAEKVASAIPKTTEKERFINFVEEEQFTLNECTPNLPQRKAIEKYNLKEDLFNKKPTKPRYENRNVIEYYDRVANTNQNQAIIVNNSNQYKNPYLPSIKQYNSILTQQMESKKYAINSEKELDHKLEKQIYEINKQKIEQETKERIEFFNKLRRDFVMNNSNLISMKQRKDKVSGF